MKLKRAPCVRAR